MKEIERCKMEQERVESPRDRDWLVLFLAEINQPPANVDGERERKEPPVGLGSKGKGGPRGREELPPDRQY